jgi:hypothetical protein
MNFESVEKIAAAILYEGYILYPYRPTAIKNRQRWNFGTLYPRDYADAQRPREPFSFVSECLLQAGADAKLDLRMRFLQLLRRPSVSSSADARSQALTDPSLEWDEGVERTATQSDLRMSDLITGPISMDLRFDSAQSAAEDASESSPNNLRAHLTVNVEALENGACKLRVDLQNITPRAKDGAATRDQALSDSFVSAHMLLGVSGAEFISLLDPPAQYAAAAAACRNIGVFPVLAGEEGARTTMLCSPIILYDYPKIAPESAGDFFDGTEMDEMLALRVLTLTEQEKQEMRNGDARARLILERTESLSEEHLMKVHGAIRGLRQLQEDGR